ncbi:MAG: hypothetical protein OXC44_00765 [Proteobacteria bacterium]|nr:hypothetical protein [Pseudomonadota bacterium]
MYWSYQKHIVTTLSLLWLCMFSSAVLANKKKDTIENYYLLKDTNSTFTLSSCATSKLSDNQQVGSDSCFAEAFIPQNEELLAQHFTEAYHSAAVLPVTGAALLGTAGSWGKHLHWLPKNWLPKTTLTQWALSLAGGAVVVGYLAEKFAASTEVFLSSNTAGNNEHESLSTFSRESLLSSTSPDPKPVPVMNIDTETHYTESNKTLLFESMDNKAFEALLNARNIRTKDYQRVKDAVITKAIKLLHVPGIFPGDHKRNLYNEYVQENSSALATVEQGRLETQAAKAQSLISASYHFLADVFKLIKSGTLRRYQSLNLVKDGYALYTRPLLVNIATQLPSIFEKTCASSQFKDLRFRECFKLYKYILSLSELSESITKDNTPNYSRLEVMHSMIASKIEARRGFYADDTKRLLFAVSKFHDDMMWFSFRISSEDQLSRVSRTRILESLVTDPSQYLNNHPQGPFDAGIFYTNSFLERHISTCIKNNQVLMFDCR